MSARSFTLIESLAVVALLALAISTLALNVAPAAGASRAQDALSAARNLDARARVLARGGTTVVLRVERDRLIAAAAGDRSDRSLLSREIPVGISITLLDIRTREPLDQLYVGSDGKSRDYLIRVTQETAVTESLVSGLTGYSFEPTRTSLAGASP